MNAMRAEQEHLLDLLVDGELSESDRRELLLWCERDPEGWRRCALAFLEAQSWSKELASIGEPEALASVPFGRGALPHDPEADASGSPIAGNEAETRAFGSPLAGPRWKVVGWSLAVAASFLVSFALGLWARGGWLQSSSDEPGAVSAQMIAEQESAEQELMDKLRHDALNGGLAPGEIPAARSQEALGQVRLVVDGPNGSSDEIQLPVVEGNAADADFLRSQPAAMPLEVQRVLERMGHRVQQRRELVPLRMQDGRRLIVPVDEVEVHPVGNRAYQ
ncbi:MAG TPA: hypothetical protein VMV10_20085 [Pirellulales bacterium]|nr:hypothetical protein [Pirellulales bacterium]